MSLFSSCFQSQMQFFMLMLIPKQRLFIVSHNLFILLQCECILSQQRWSRSLAYNPSCDASEDKTSARRAKTGPLFLTLRCEEGAMTLSVMTFILMTFILMTFSIMTFSIMTSSIMTFSFMTLSIMTFSMMMLCIMRFCY